MDVWSFIGVAYTQIKRRRKHPILTFESLEDKAAELQYLRKHTAFREQGRRSPVRGPVPNLDSRYALLAIPH